MEKNILVFGASSSRKSINHQLAVWAAKQLEDVTLDIVDLNDYEMPIYSVDKEAADGIPQLAYDFKKKINEADGILISFAEHNGNVAAAFKNIFDWFSRIDKLIWSNKPMLLLATSPGGRGAQSALQMATNSFPHQGGHITGTFSLPSFQQNFDSEQGVINSELAELLATNLTTFGSAVVN